MKQIAVIVNPYLREEYELYQPRRLKEELARLGATAEILPNCGLGYAAREGLCESLSRKYSAAIYLDKDRYLPRMLEKRGMRLFNRAEAVETCDDKALTQIALSGVVPMPKTVFGPLCYKPRETPLDPARAGELLGYPVVVKECFGSLGAQVYLAKEEGELRRLAEELKLRPHLLQEFIASSAGRDVRAVCVGGKVVACMERFAPDGDFRSNAALGGKARPFAPTEEIEAIASAVCERIPLDYCGIDLLFGTEGFLVCEVNSNAFFKTAEAVTGCNVAGAYAAHICREMEA